MHKNDMIATERRKRRKGLTLAEIIVVITLLSVVAAILFGSLGGILDEGKKDAAKLSIAQIENALGIYKLKSNKYPKSLDEASKYMKGGKVPNDPWDQPFEYSTSSNCGEDYEIVSIGADGKRGGDDDVSSCEKK